MTDKDKKKYKSIADLLNIDGSDGSFDDDDEARKAKQRQEERDASAKALREKIRSLKYGDDEEYKREMLKILGQEGMEVLLHMKHDVEDNPSARSAETVAALISSISNTVGDLEKIDNNKRKNEVDQLKIQAMSNPQSLINGDNNIALISTSKDLLNMLEEGGVLGNKEEKTIDAEAEVLEEKDEDEEPTDNKESKESKKEE